MDVGMGLLFFLRVTSRPPQPISKGLSASRRVPEVKSRHATPKRLGCTSYNRISEIPCPGIKIFQVELCQFLKIRNRELGFFLPTCEMGNDS